MTSSRLVIARLHGLAGRSEELRGLCGDLATATAAEPGCRRFEVLELAAAGEIVLLVDWASERALREHFATPHYRRYRAAVGELLAGPSDVTVHHVSDTVHALDPNPPDPAMFG
jgi:quinol monooxygenase YgiN